jgi:hypothetical protein
VGTAVAAVTNCCRCLLLLPLSQLLLLPATVVSTACACCSPPQGLNVMHANKHKCDQEWRTHLCS